MRYKQIKLSAVLLAVILILGGCSFLTIKRTPKPAPTPLPADNNQNNQENNQGNNSIENKLAAQTKIKKFENPEELKNFLEEKSGSTGSYGYGGGMAFSRNNVMEDSGADIMWGAPSEINSTIGLGSREISPGAAKQTAPDYSRTNVQVEGVDEADIIKTDGKYIYAVANNNLFIILANPAESAEIISKIEFKSRPQDIYINGDNLIVFGQDQELRATELYRNFKRRSQFSFFKVFDIKDKKNPKVSRELNFEGNYSNSRMIGDYVYFITNYYSYNFIDETPVPMIVENKTDVINKCLSDKCIMPPVYYFDMPYDNFNFTSVAAINVKDAGEKVSSESYLLSGNQNMYVSENNIYITYTKYISEDELSMAIARELIMPKLNENDRGRIEKIEKTENYILAPREKIAKIGAIMEKYFNTLSEDDREKMQKDMEEVMKKKYQDISKELEKTVIHKIAINKGKLEYKTFGEVTGQVLNQFSMDENNGYFRIATTKNRTWSQYAEAGQKDSYSNMYVLDENLKLAGSLEDLAKGEKIYSVRFMQGRAYMVTFKQTDPLFVIDLKDPKNPKVLGQLKIPGFSNYLHPYDENTLIGLGKGTEENEWGGVITKGVKLSLFDVTDVANPKEISKFELGDRGSDSIALNDHKAFLFSKEKNLLVIPASIYESTGDKNGYGKFAFSGAVIFKIDKTGFELRGKIDHSDGGKMGRGEYSDGYSYYDNTVKRSLYINDVLYTFSSKYLKMNKLGDLELVKNLELKKDSSGSGSDFQIIN